MKSWGDNEKAEGQKMKRRYIRMAIQNFQHDRGERNLRRFSLRRKARGLKKRSWVEE